MVLSYRHAFHCGSHADVFKHALLVPYLRRCAQVCGALPEIKGKSKLKGKNGTSLAMGELAVEEPNNLTYIETHAGAGRYSLKDGFSQKLKEYETGIKKLIPAWRGAGADLKSLRKSFNQKQQRLASSTNSVSANKAGQGAETVSTKLPEEDIPLLRRNAELNRYVNIVQSYNQNIFKRLVHYPGSPLIACEYLKSLGVKGRRILYELHSSDHKIASETFSPERWPEVRVFKSDGLGSLSVRKTLRTSEPVAMHVDPSYEGGIEYSLIGKIAKRLVKKPDLFMMIWYPKLREREEEPQKMIENLKALDTTFPWLHVDISKVVPGRNITGSGLFFLNAPPGLENDIREIAPALTSVIGGDVYLGSGERPLGSADRIATEPVELIVRERREIEYASRRRISRFEKSLNEDQPLPHAQRSAPRIKFL